jgi:hypothetical protein
MNIIKQLEEAVEAGKELGPCTWFYLLILMGRKKELGGPIQKHLIARSLGRILLWAVNRNGKGNVVSLKAPYVRNAITLYAKEHKCYPYDGAQTSPQVERIIKAHMRAIMAVVRRWVRLAPPCDPGNPTVCQRHLMVRADWLRQFLSGLA